MPLIHALEAQGVVIQVASRQFLDEKSEGAVHQGIIARVKPGRQYQENDLPDLIALSISRSFWILDGVTDPHNLGACLRSADAAGVHAVIVPKDRSGAAECHGEKSGLRRGGKRPADPRHQPGAYHAYAAGREVWIVGTAGEADHTLFQSKMTGSLALVMGAEGEGMRRLTREHCDELISIPMAGSVSSLNVSVATVFACLKRYASAANLFFPNNHSLEWLIFFSSDRFSLYPTGNVETSFNIVQDLAQG
ncbi:23S rRNA (guanosine-2'-O-)-methyltransferase [Klebsiella michiganensis]|nr:23S rRNA (guanosine-2'-O-)-methyltransferase [Klebsiella michiganensis]